MKPDENFMGSEEYCKEYMRRASYYNDIHTIKGDEFRRLLAFAHNEGLLDGLLQDIGYLDFQGRVRQSDPLQSEPSTEPENQAMPSQSADRDYPQNACRSTSPKWWSRWFPWS